MQRPTARGHGGEDDGGGGGCVGGVGDEFGGDTTSMPVIISAAMPTTHTTMSPGRPRVDTANAMDESFLNPPEGDAIARANHLEPNLQLDTHSGTPSSGFVLTIGDVPISA